MRVAWRLIVNPENPLFKGCSRFKCLVQLLAASGAPCSYSIAATLSLIFCFLSQRSGHERKFLWMKRNCVLREYIQNHAENEIIPNFTPLHVRTFWSRYCTVHHCCRNAWMNSRFVFPKSRSLMYLLYVRVFVYVMQCVCLIFHRLVNIIISFYVWYDARRDFSFLSATSALTRSSSSESMLSKIWTKFLTKVIWRRLNARVWWKFLNEKWRKMSQET